MHASDSSARRALPVVQRWTAHAELVGYSLRTFLTRAKLHDSRSETGRAPKGVIVKGSGHWLMEEAPEQVIPALVNFLG
ncbi:hypothetical protein [Variovorax sp. EBFNA2]|uniref:alpha/beta fold hydrolase n=1 Tax=Variovorax sp. EBFNA2 TaxID=3342097 RepID=UPI0029C024F4|nr:hypothetical protein [Variovorax boronicumulans]WPG40840.1 hypothetical protein RZE79_22300 [Variovorax boronicumulans]